MTKKIKKTRKVKFDWLNHSVNFVAIIIGVYLGFYMNERTKANQNRQESLVLMNSLRTDLQSDIESYESYQIPENKRHQINVSDLLNILLKDSLSGNEDQLSTIFAVQNYEPSSATYSSMKSSGKLSLLNDLPLQNELANFYEGFVLESIDKGKSQVDFFSDELLPWYMNNLDFVSMQVLNGSELVVLRNKLIIYETLIDQKVQSYEGIVRESKALKNTIDVLIAERE
ncbi:hypothetical protein SAMN05661096_03830 [Marivirga sericea]|uniref:Uncharacterized protein n=1 Tax=Marivirga sericea TaxID=1028 RepID=A0A1X7LDD1_9BACT|nr:DUF6090 family protein [Marivirga sericea]SMG51868.1 hypothetical protein SAMN05661096_03830 [Marivirga sericea]